jgi:DNA-binding NtrC family response regulator
MSLDERLANYEKSLIIDALKKSRGVQAKAAKLLGINQRSLWHRTKKYEINVQKIKKQQNL